ncbi:MAG: uroporphyrinogen-III synthase [Rhodobacteraceae bacterium]|nr:uroporphyrinogen-III synthase [Paracoccaceae bacterium]TVR46562.1 MAG: uroporphyrinogen-III synthase [Paracoccaceae bacterium]
MPPCLILTRPRHESARFAHDARQAGWRGAIVCAPLLRIEPLPVPPHVLAGAGSLVVTSQHAVTALARATRRRDWPIWCVGPRTGQAAQAAGFAQVRVAGGDAVSLRARLIADPPREPVLHLRGNHAAMDIAAELRAQGIEAQAQVVYRQEALALPAEAAARFAQGGDLVLPVFSPRSARLLVAALAPLRPDAAHLHLLAISAAARDAALAGPDNGARGLVWQGVQVAARPDAPAMLAGILALQAALEPLKKPR